MLLRKEILKKAGLVVLSILLSLFIAELVLRALYPQKQKYFVWQPNLSHTFYPDPSIFYGINGSKQFSINSQGFRGDEFKNNSAKKYLCIGGSTTECLYLDNKETWCYLVQDYLNTKYSILNTTGSIGKSGCTTRENYIQLKYYVPQLGKIDGVILMVGLNDMMKRLSRDTLFEDNFRFTPLVEDSLVRSTLLTTGTEKTWWRRTALFRLAQSTLHRTNKVEWENVQDDSGKVYSTWRKNRQQAPVLIDSLPDLSTALDEFERNLQLIYRETQRQGIKLILVNQSALYKGTMSEFENSLLWMGGKGNFQQSAGCSYYSARYLAVGLSLYNQRMQRFCADKPLIKFINLATELPRDTSVFYDDCHFSEKGAKKVAAIISEQLIQ